MLAAYTWGSPMTCHHVGTGNTQKKMTQLQEMMTREKVWWLVMQDKLGIPTIRYFHPTEGEGTCKGPYCEFKVVGAARDCSRASKEAGKGNIWGIFMEGRRVELGLKDRGVCWQQRGETPGREALWIKAHSWHHSCKSNLKEQRDGCASGKHFLHEKSRDICLFTKQSGLYHGGPWEQDHSDESGHLFSRSLSLWRVARMTLSLTSQWGAYWILIFNVLNATNNTFSPRPGYLGPGIKRDLFLGLEKVLTKIWG